MKIRITEEMRQFCAHMVAEKPVAVEFPDCVGKIKQGLCPTPECDNKVEEFRDEGSLDEYFISGMCQECQDGLFGGPGDEDEDDEAMNSCCEICGVPGAEDVPDHGYTRSLCEGCARTEVPYLFSDRRKS